MSTVEDYEESDYRFVRESIFSPDWTPAPLPSSNWRGIVQENRALTPNPTPTGLLEAPTVFGAWKLDYEPVEADYGGTNASGRRGIMTVARYVEPLVGKEPMRNFRRAVLNRIDAVEAAAETPLCFDLQGSKTVTVGFLGPWFVENLVIPFVGD